MRELKMPAQEALILVRDWRAEERRLKEAGFDLDRPIDLARYEDTDECIWRQEDVP